MYKYKYIIPMYHVFNSIKYKHINTKLEYKKYKNI